MDSKYVYNATPYFVLLLQYIIINPTNSDTPLHANTVVAAASVINGNSITPFADNLHAPPVNSEDTGVVMNIVDFVRAAQDLGIGISESDLITE